MKIKLSWEYISSIENRYCLTEAFSEIESQISHQKVSGPGVFDPPDETVAHLVRADECEGRDSNQNQTCSLTSFAVRDW
jgi:hypothetical protein